MKIRIDSNEWKRFISVLEDGGSVHKAAVKVGYNPHAVYIRMRRDKSFKRLISRANNKYNDKLLDLIIELLSNPDVPQTLVESTKEKLAKLGYVSKKDKHG